MEIRELLGYACLVLAFFGTIGAIWAARHFSRHRVYMRNLARERRTRRKERAEQTEAREPKA